MFGTAAVAALMSIFTLVRHTRAEEEAGRLELVRSAPVGRHAADRRTGRGDGRELIIGALLAPSFPTISTLSVEGCMPAAAVTTIGLVFASVAAVMVQVSELPLRRHVGSAEGIAYAVEVGDVNENFLSYVALGWGMQTAPWC